MNKNKIKKAYIILSNIIGIIGFGYGIITIIKSFDNNIIEILFDEFIIFVNTIYIIELIWITYAILIVINKIKSKQSK